MKCPHCGHPEDKVIDSRPVDDNSAIRRRRECLNCHARFTTYEKVESIPIYVVKRDGGRQPFDRKKLLSSIMKSCAKRPVSAERLEELVDDVERIAGQNPHREISSREIGERVLDGLRQLDSVAYVRFASVYREFDDLKSFYEELRSFPDSEQ